jgi:hypothetical protein
MSNLAITPIPRETIDYASQIIQLQGATPSSPGLMLADGTVVLCAAAALAAAGLEMSEQHERRQRFIEEILANRSSDGIRKVFTELGWPVQVCDRAVAKNDQLPPEERQAGVISYFRSL